MAPHPALNGLRGKHGSQPSPPLQRCRPAALGRALTTARDIALSDFCSYQSVGANLGPGPDQLDLRSRMRWHPPAAGFLTVTFADGLLILSRKAARGLPQLPGKPVTRTQTGAELATKIVSPFVPGSELIRNLAEVAADTAIDALGERYERAHPEREQAWLKSKANWQRAFADQLVDHPDIHVVPRVDIVDVSITPFMVFGLSIRSISHEGEESAYTWRASAPARHATTRAGIGFGAASNAN